MEPDYRKNSASAKALVEEPETATVKKRDDELLWYPPLGLMKLATFHKRRGMKSDLFLDATNRYLNLKICHFFHQLTFGIEFILQPYLPINGKRQ